MPSLPHRGFSSTQSPLRLRIGAAIVVVMMHVALAASLYRSQHQDAQQRQKTEVMVVNLIEASMAKQAAVASVRESRQEDASLFEIARDAVPLLTSRPSSKQPRLASRPLPRSTMQPLVPPAQPPHVSALPSASLAAAATPQNLPRQSGDEPVRVSKVEYAGKRPLPEYPRLSRERQEEGTTIVLVDIDTQGRVIKAVVGTSSGYARLDEAALKAAHEAHFKPYTRDGIAYPSQTKLPFVFTLKRK
jgi:protein TonB